MSFDHLTEEQHMLRRARAQEQAQAFSDGWFRPALSDDDFVARLIEDGGHEVCPEAEVFPGRQVGRYGVVLVRQDRAIPVVSYAVVMDVAA